METPIRERDDLRRGLPTLHARGALAMLVVSIVLAGISAYGCHIVLAAKGEHASILPSIAYGLVKWLWWGIVAFGVWSAAQKVPRFLTFSPRMIALNVLIGTVGSVIHLILLQATWWGGLQWNEWRLAYPRIDYFTLSSFGEDLIIYGFLFGFSGFLHMQSHRHPASRSRSRLSPTEPAGLASGRSLRRLRSRWSLEKIGNELIED